MEEPKPPGRISDQNLKRHYMPAVRTWPAGCGPRSDQFQPSDLSQSHLPSKELEDGEISETEEGRIRNSEIDEGQNGNSVEGQNGNYVKRAEVYPYPPPKKRGFVAYRTWPAGCGREVQIEKKKKNVDLEIEKKNNVNSLEIEKENNDNNLEIEKKSNDTSLEIEEENNDNNLEIEKKNNANSLEIEKKESVNQTGGLRNNDQIKDDLNCVGFREMGREKIKGKVVSLANKSEAKDEERENNVHKEGQRKGEIKPVRIKIICGKKNSERSNSIGEFSRSPAEVAKDKREKSEQSNTICEFSKGPADLAKEKREKSVSSEASNNYYSKSPAEVAKEKREKDRLNSASKNVKTIATKRVGIKRKTDDNNSSFESQLVAESEELGAVTTRAIIHSQNSLLRITAKKSVSHPHFNTNYTNKSNLAPPHSYCNKRPAKKSNKSKSIIKKGAKKPTDPRSKVKRCQFLFQMLCRKLIHEEETGNKPPDISRNRIDLRAAKMLREENEILHKDNPIVGAIPGVEIGDEYRYRAEMAILGLHRPPQAGIDFCDKNGVKLATSIVASGGYSDAREYSDLLIYTGAGGQPNTKLGRLQPEDQKLERGNLALKNSMEKKSPVRVIHGVNIGESSKVVMSFAYDGLYLVEKYWTEMQSYEVKNQSFESKVFKFQLRRIAGQPELTWNKATRVKRSKEVREGLCCKDISGGREKNAICAINNVDDEKPPVFKYITKTVYPDWCEKVRPKGCKCKGKCSETKGCECVAKNGGEIPFNFNGAIVQAKTLVYECGPACKCDKSCPNRVTQNGIQIPLEIYKTEKRGWGVRSLNSIMSGTFICEYVGELLRDEEANERENDEYLFEIGKNYDDVAIWGDLPSFVPKSESGPDLSEGEMEGFTIDAGKMGNVGRFINHSCSPNLYAQNVLFDHDDIKMPHIMFFAMENIPPLQELTYHYNYKIGEVRDCEGNLKMKECCCGSSECKGRLY